MLLTDNKHFLVCGRVHERAEPIGNKANLRDLIAAIGLTLAGAPLHSHWLATRHRTGRRPRCIHWKCLRFGDTLTLNNSTDAKYPWMPHSHLTDWIFISSVSIWDITPLCRFTIFSKNDFWRKLVFTILLIPADITVLPMQRFSSRARVMVVPACDHPWRHQRSRESRDHHYDAQPIYRIQRSLLPGTMHSS